MSSSKPTPRSSRLKTQETHIYDPQTAVVVGEVEIGCDEYGRILVKFPVMQLVPNDFQYVAGSAGGTALKTSPGVSASAKTGLPKSGAA